MQTTLRSDAPHLHFRIMDGPLPLASEDIPYLIPRFVTSRRAVSERAYLAAQHRGTPMRQRVVPRPGPRARMLPLSLWAIDF